MSVLPLYLVEPTSVICPTPPLLNDDSETTQGRRNCTPSCCRHHHTQRRPYLQVREIQSRVLSTIVAVGLTRLACDQVAFVSFLGPYHHGLKGHWKLGMRTCFRSTEHPRIHNPWGVTLEHLGYKVQARYCAATTMPDSTGEPLSQVRLLAALRGGFIPLVRAPRLCIRWHHSAESMP